MGPWHLPLCCCYCCFCCFCFSDRFVGLLSFFCSLLPGQQGGQFVSVYIPTVICCLTKTPKPRVPSARDWNLRTVGMATLFPLTVHYTGCLGNERKLIGHDLSSNLGPY